MKLIKDTLKANFDRWEDPGDYPSNAGQFPQPPGPWYAKDVEGEYVVELDGGHELISLLHTLLGTDGQGFEDVQEYIREEVEAVADDVLVTEWEWEFKFSSSGKATLTLTASEIEGTP